MLSTTMCASGILAVIAVCGTIRSSIDARRPSAEALQAATSPNSFVSGQMTDEELFARLHERHVWQESHLSEFSVLRTYTVRKVNEEIVAQDVVTMRYSPPGTKAFTIISAKGSRFVRTHVFQQLMAREAARTKSRSDSDDLITPENYRFEITGRSKLALMNALQSTRFPKLRKQISSKGKSGLIARTSQLLRSKAI